jgi:hypothetical protein
MAANPRHLRDLCAVLLVLAMLGFSASLVRAQDGRAVIPPGQEDLLSRTLTPPLDLLPDGVDIKGLSISRDTVTLSTVRGGNIETVEIGLGRPPRDSCLTATLLYACPSESGLSWLAAYVEQLAVSGAADEAARAWTQIEAPATIQTVESEPQAAQPFEAPTAWFSAIGAGLWVLFLGLAWRRGRTRPDAAQVGLTINLMMSVALFTQMLALLAGRGVAIAAAITITLAVLLLRGLWKRRTVSVQTAVRALFASGYAPLVLIFLLVGLLIPVGGGPLSGILVAVRRAWFADDALRASLTHLWYAALWLLVLVVFLRAAWPERRSALRELFWLLPALALAFWTLSPILESAAGALDPDAIFVEWQAPVWLAAGALPHFEHYLMGAAAPASWVLKVVGLTPNGVSAVREFALFVWLAAVALAARSWLRSRLAALFALALATALPIMPFLATEGWWFMLGAGVALLSLAALERSLALEHPGWGLLALALAHLAFDIRPEAMVLVPVFLLARAQSGSLSRTLDIAAVLVFSLDLLRLLILGAGELRVGAGVLENLSRYMDLWAQLWPWWLLSAVGLWRLARIAPDRAARLALLTLGGMGLFIVSNTVPSQREVVSMFSPLMIACGAFLLSGNPVKPLRHPASAVLLAFALLALFSYAGAPVRSESQGFRQRAQARIDDMQALMERLPRDLPLLLDPIYLRLRDPGRVRLLESPMSINTERLEAALGDSHESLCVNDLGRDDACCFYEIDPGPLDRDAQQVPDFVWGRCWPVRALAGWTASEAAKAGKLTALRLQRTSRNGDAP